MSETQFDTEREHSNESKFSAVINSMLLIISMTLIFGALSYAMIQVNNTFFQLSISEGLWCGLAMALATGYYLLQRSRKKPTENQNQ